MYADIVSVVAVVRGFDSVSAAAAAAAVVFVVVVSVVVAVPACGRPSALNKYKTQIHTRYYSSTYNQKQMPIFLF